MELVYLLFMVKRRKALAPVRSCAYLSFLSRWTYSWSERPSRWSEHPRPRPPLCSKRLIRLSVLPFRWFFESTFLPSVFNQSGCFCIIFFILCVCSLNYGPTHRSCSRHQFNACFYFAVIIHKAGGMSIMIFYACLHGMYDDFRHLLKGPFGLVGKPLCLSQPMDWLAIASCS